MDNKNMISYNVRTILESNTSPLAKFFCLLRIDSIAEANNDKRKENIWNQIQVKMREKQNEV